MSNRESWDKLWSDGFGWINPSKEVFTCKLYEHFSLLENVPEFSAAVAKYNGICESNETAMNEDLNSLGPDEHPCMHLYAFMNDDAKAELIQIIYGAGWIRLGMQLDLNIGRDGTKLNLKDPAHFKLDCEGYKEPMIKLRPTLIRMAKHIGCSLNLNPIKYEFTKWSPKEKVYLPDPF